MKEMLIHYMDVSCLDFNKIKHFLSKERIYKSNQFFFKKDKQLSMGVEVLLKYSLNNLGINDPQLSRDEKGKPFIKNYPDVFFNLSHSEKYAACAIADKPIGVDIEHIQPIDLELARQFFFGDEYQYLMRQNDKKKAFFKLWVLKESYMKMTGLGFRLSLDEFSIELKDHIRVKHNNRYLNDYNLNQWLIKDQYMLGVCSGATLTKPKSIKLWEIEK